LAQEVFADADLALLWAPNAGGAIASRLHALGVRKALFILPPPQAGSRRHVALQLLGALQPLGVAAPMSLAELSLLVPPLRWSKKAQDEADVAWESMRAALAGRPPIAIHPGSGAARKRWPAGDFASLIRDLAHDFAPVLIAGPQDEEIVAQVIAEVRATSVVRDLSVAGLAAFFSACVLYVGNDSGVTHLAGMLGIPTIALFGPTDPTLWAPLGPRVLALRSSTERMEDLSPEAVIEPIQHMMRREAGE
jgi:ADP-heptose:LPS heptosyltransferase